MNKSTFTFAFSLGCALTYAFLYLIAIVFQVDESGLTEDQRQRLAGYIGHDGWCAHYRGGREVTCTNFNFPDCACATCTSGGFPDRCRDETWSAEVIADADESKEDEL